MKSMNQNTVNQKINSLIPLFGGVSGWVNKKDIYFLIYRHLVK